MIKSELSDVVLLKSEDFYNHDTEQVFTNIAFHLLFHQLTSHSLPSIFTNLFLMLNVFWTPVKGKYANDCNPHCPHSPIHSWFPSYSSLFFQENVSCHGLTDTTLGINFSISTIFFYSGPNFKGSPNSAISIYGHPGRYMIYSSLSKKAAD